MKKISFAHSVFKNPEITDNGILAYAALRLVGKNTQPDVNANPAYMYYLLCGDRQAITNLPDAVRDDLIDGVENLISTGVLYDSFFYAKSSFLYNPESISTTTKTPFFVVNDEYIHTIMDTGNPSLLVFFLRLVDCFFWNQKANIFITYMRTPSLVNETKVHKNTYYKYIKILQNLEIIYINKTKYYYSFKGGDIGAVPHTIGFYSDKDAIDKIADVYAQNCINVISKHKGKEK